MRRSRKRRDKPDPFYEAIAREALYKFLVPEIDQKPVLVSVKGKTAVVTTESGKIKLKLMTEK